MSCIQLSFSSIFIHSGSRRIPWPPSSWLLHKEAIVSSSETLLNFVNILDIYSNKPPHERNPPFPCIYICICSSVSHVQCSACVLNLESLVAIFLIPAKFMQPLKVHSIMTMVGRVPKEQIFNRDFLTLDAQAALQRGQASVLWHRKG